MKGLITRQQYDAINKYCLEYGFWAALGYATRLKYRNHPELKKKYEYRSEVILPSNQRLLDYVTKGAWSDKGRKRRRVARNIYEKPNGSYAEFNRFRWGNKSPEGWSVFKVNRKTNTVWWRREIKAI